MSSIIDEAGFPVKTTENLCHKGLETGWRIHKSKRHAFPLVTPEGVTKCLVSLSIGICQNPDARSSV